ncbi:MULTISPECIES: hypothetical protein [Methanobacterium]|uniref:Uncharacterized protein n=1 Tax=Methanobacterium veterum TaxID=408577 RepID=A0A9E5DG86_9EURY|nr:MULTISPECIES: hypothetical protein [Methanobacterium]MCZ3364286.1 hypothetical protein [Methanobacterium veterum]MCZ3372033.1 hypothetical protein [Methanobacterium veterum]
MNNIDKLKEWFNRQSNTNKAVLGLSLFCIGSILFIAMAGILVPDITYLSLETPNAQIDNSTLEYTITGSSEPNAQVFLYDADLNLNKVPVKVDNNGNFSYNLNIPLSVTDTKVSVVSQVHGKYEVSQDMEIQRPLTFLSIKPMQELSYGNKSLVLEGKSDPGATIHIISNMTLRSNLNLQSYVDTAFNDPVINNITLKADSNGYFKQDFYVPLNSTSAYFNVTATSTGKRDSTQVQNVTRDYDIFPSIMSIFNSSYLSNSVKVKNFTGKGFSITYPAVWERQSYKNAGKDARLDLIYGNSVEAIVWYGKIGNEFGNSLEDYKNTQDVHIRTWWGGTEVFEQDINKNGMTGFRTVYKCQNNPVFSNDIAAPFYIDRTTVTKDNVSVYELQLMVFSDYYEKNDYLIEQTVNSFKII